MKLIFNLGKEERYSLSVQLSLRTVKLRLEIQLSQETKHKKKEEESSGLLTNQKLHRAINFSRIKH